MPSLMCLGNKKKEWRLEGLPWRYPVVKTPRFQHSGCGFRPWGGGELGPRMPRGAAKKSKR